MTRNFKVVRVKQPQGYDIPKRTDNEDNNKIETHVHGKLTVTKNSKGIQKVSLISKRSS